MSFRSVFIASCFAAFAAHIAQIVGLRSLPEMFWPNASAVAEVAGVQDVWFETPSFKLMVRADRRVNVCAARFAL